MLRDFKFLRRNSGKNEEIENVPENPKDSLVFQTGIDSSRPPLNTIQAPIQMARQEQEVGFRSKVERTPTKAKGKSSDPTLPLRTPDKHGAGFSAKNRFAWAQKHEPGLITGDSRDDGSNYSGQVKGVAGTVNGGLVSMTPRPARVVGRGASSYSESNSTQSTPSKSVSKPPSSGIRSRVDGHTSTRTGNFAALYKGLPISCSPATAVNTMEVPHFDLKEDPSFWMEHSVQVLIRVRPLNSMEKSTHGYNRCLKQESAQTIAWIGQPETRFTFDHVACETVEQETLFRMVGLPMVENCLSGYNSCMFAYGQTGSGKTYTMLGEIDDLEIKPSPHRGMTPRIFEFLFARIQAEEEIRKDEKLKYTCKCSFLEIYNEQITDLLDPSSANLMLREDVKKGVYVENLSEFEVQTVSEILRLLTQGSSNRRVAATNMNRESSRSHSVFTCVIESRWEKDSATNLRFARLNLVDLAGSERQKTSGAEGERLKEAANINKSLSTLGHVIMVLVDVAHGKLRHIPYRDSRLTFLLQDSLGGNSKTMIIANVSPSICCASETLNTLKFAQRAKLIQNNAVVNEDSTGDVIALQHQIRLLKEELSILKRQNVSRSLSFGLTTIEDTTTAQENACMENIHDVNMEIDDIHDVNMEIDDLPEYASKGIVRLSTKQLKSLETTLAGSLRREQMAETSIKQLEAEVEQLNRLVRQREEDTRCSKMMLRFREDKIQRMESLLGGSVPADAYLLEENRALSEEIQLLQAKVDRNPEVTRFALENIRLLDQLRRFQEFYEEGEREILLSEVSALRDQLLQFIDGSSKQHNDLNSNMQPEFKNTLGELEKCRDQLKSCLEDNAKLRRELDDLHTMLENIRYEPYEHDGVNKTIKDSINGPAVEDEVLKVVQSENLEGKHESLLIKHAEEMVNLQLELDILKIIIKEERSTCREMEETAICYDRDLQVAKEKLLLTSKKYEDAKCELEEAKSIIEALESQQILSINEMEELRNTNSHYQQLLSKQEPEIMALKDQLAFKELQFHSPSTRTERDNSPLEANLKRMQASLEKAKRLNNWYRGDRAHQVSNEEEMDEVRRQAEAETAEVIVCMQEELGILQHQVQDSHLKEMEMKTAGTLLETELKEVQEKLYIITDDNKSLNQKLEEKDRELLILSEEWDLLTCEIEEILADGHDTLINASDQLELISSSFPHRRIWISDQVGKMIKIISEKELMIEELRSCLEDANNKRSDVECMLKSLRGAAMVITEAHQQECSEKEKEILQLMSELTTKTSTVAKLEDRNKWAEDQIGKVSGCATVAFVIVNRLSEMNNSYRDALKHKDFQLGESVEMNLRKDALLNDQAEMIEEADKKIQSLRGEVKDLEGTCGKLREKISVEQERSCGMEQKLKTIEEIDILMTKEKLAELQSGVSTLKSCMSSYGEHCGSPARKDSQEVCTSFDGDGEGEGPTDAETNKVSDRDLNCVEDLTLDTSEYSRVGKSVCCPSYDEKNLESRRIGRDMGNKDVTIILLKKEIQSALESLKEVQAEMVKLHDEKKQMQVSEKCSQESMKCLTTQVLAMEAAMSNFEKQYILKTEAFGNRLSVFEQTVEEAGSQWCQTKELLELEVGGAKMVAAQKAAEASCIMAKFQEAQNTMKDADIMINKLVIANEKLKLDIERRKETEVGLINDRSLLTDEVQSLQNINDLKNQQFEDLEKQLGSHLTETRDLVSEIECAITEFQTTLSKNLMSLGCDLRCMKSLLVNSTKLVHSWLEGVWSQIIVKDSAVSVLHLCHMGILLETVTGLNTENGLLQHGLCESNSAIADLRERNFKSIRELEMCRILKGKLLADIKNSFDKISRKEEETGELRVKVSTFEKQISDLQLQEELMLQRSNDMGSQLSILMKELDLSNNNVLACLLDQEKILKYKEMVLESQADLFMVGWFSKDFESLILVSELEEMALQKADAEKEHIKCCSVLENLKKEIIFSKVDAELKTKLLQDQESQVSLLEKQIQEETLERKDLLSKLNVSNSRISQMEEVTDQGIQSLKDVTFLNGRLKVELVDVNETKVRLLNQVQAHEADYENLLHDFKTKERALEVSLSQMSALDERNKDLQKNICTMETFLCELQNELDMKNAELSRMSCLADENESLKGEIMKLNAQKRQVLQDLEGKNSEFESSLSRIGVFHEENQRLQNEIISLEPGIVSLKTELEMKNAEMNELQHSQSVILEELCSRTQDCQSFVNNVKSLEEQNAFLRNEICSHKNTMHESFSISSLNIMKCIDTVEALDIMGSRLLNVLDGKGSSVVDKMSQEISENIERTCKFMEEFDRLECHAKELVSENLNLQAELLRKEDVLRGLLFDLSLLQESASNTKDQKEEIEEMVVSVEALEDELAVKTGELDLALAKIQMLEDQLRDKIDIISVHELDLSKERESLEMLSVENLELGARIEDALAAQSILEEELTEKKKIIESLEMELTEMSNALGLMNNSIESLGSNMNELASERDLLQIEVNSWKEKFERVKTLADKNETIAMEAQQVAESRKVYAEDKETEVKLLERSVEELERTINVLENKVNILKGEAERQRLQREELESELHAVKDQMQNVKNADSDMKRHLDEKEKNLQEALEHMQILERDIVEKDAEITQLKAHLSELNLHAEAQASDYKQKFKALEAMAEQVRPEGHSAQLMNSLSNKSEKYATKSRGSGSPFKCIGLGLAHQIKSEKDEELTAAKLHIEELEFLAVSRQKEIFALNARLAAAESMTHDVIRDLLGVKLDMTNYASMLDNEQVQKITEKARLHSLESQEKEQEVVKLKKQLNEFVEERRGWLEEIDRKQAEMVGAQIALEKLWRQDQLHKTENEMLKIENLHRKQKVMELEGEVKKLSGQQNLQQRIHHHAKIKDENNMLKTQNEELSSKLRRTEVILSRVKEELACFRASIGKNPYIDFDEEHRLNIKLKETEEEKVQLAQRLLGLCTSVLKAVGITKPVSNVSPSDAEDALEQLKNRFTALERELQELKYKNRITNERIRLTELMPQSSPINSADEKCRTPGRASHAAFFSALDR